MRQYNDYLRNDIREYHGYAGNEDGHNPSPEYSSSAMEMFYVAYSNINWDFTKSVICDGSKQLRFGEISGYQITPKSSYYSTIGTNVAVTGQLDFNPDEPIYSVGELTRNLNQNQDLLKAWSALWSRQYSFLNMSLTLIVDGVRLPTPKMIPVFLYNFNRYLAGESHNLFYFFTDRQKEVFIKYLDNAFDKYNSSTDEFYVQNYCRKVLLLEDPQLILSLLDYGKLIQSKQELCKPMFETQEDIYKFINLVTWYWAEKEVNILL